MNEKINFPKKESTSFTYRSFRRGKINIRVKSSTYQMPFAGRGKTNFLLKENSFTGSHLHIKCF